jgi:hypothetical protein
MSPPSYGAAVPQLLLDDVDVPELTRDLLSMLVHAANGESTAEVRVLGSVDSRMELDTTELGIDVSAQRRLFSGRINAIESHHDADAPPSYVLMATGPAPDGSEGPSVTLRSGIELLSGSVRRTADAVTARCIAGPVDLCPGSPVTLVDGDPHFAGRYRVHEVWHRFDTAHGIRVEFVARG